MRPLLQKNSAGIYIHWPFCARKCPYCDFYTFGREHVYFDLAERYLFALLRDIQTFRERSSSAERPEADTIYFGGGTPSLMSPQQLERIMEAISAEFEIRGGAEITMEVNPTAAEASRLAAFRSLGVNRLSVGVQSFQDRFLKVLGRDHDAATAREVLRMIRRLGFQNVSLDLMFGLPDQSVEDFKMDLEEALSFEPEHLSAYGLTLHEGTPFKRWNDEGKLRLPEPDDEAAMFEHLMDRLGEAGYEHYEISNWCSPGRESRHNSKYWRDCDVFAFGVSAHGVVGGVRFAQPRDLTGYLTGSVGSPERTEPGGAGEIMMLAVRRIGGVTWDELAEWIGDDPRRLFGTEIGSLITRGWIEESEEALRLTRSGILFADDVATAFF